MLETMEQIKRAQAISSQMNKFFNKEDVFNLGNTITATHDYAFNFVAAGKVFRATFAPSARLRAMKHSILVMVEDYIFETAANEFHKQMVQRNVEEDLTIVPSMGSTFTGYEVTVYRDGKELFTRKYERSLNVQSEMKELLDSAIGYKEIRRSMYRVR